MIYFVGGLCFALGWLAMYVVINLFIIRGYLTEGFLDVDHENRLVHVRIQTESYENKKAKYVLLKVNNDAHLDEDATR